MVLASTELIYDVPRGQNRGHLSYKTSAYQFLLFFKRKLDKPKTSWYHCGDCFCINGNLCWQQSPAGCAISDWITENMRACPAWNSCKIPPFRSNLRPESGKPATCDHCRCWSMWGGSSKIHKIRHFYRTRGCQQKSAGRARAQHLTAVVEPCLITIEMAPWHLPHFLVQTLRSNLQGQSQNIKSLHKELLSSFWISCRNTLTW